MQGKVVSINISEQKGTVKNPVRQCVLVTGFGLEGDAHGGNHHRQVSLLAQESIDKMTDMSIPGLTPGKFAENITTQGLTLHELPIGTKLAIGETLQEVTQIGKQCHHGCAIKQQTGQCIMPTEGIFTRVLQGGVVNVGDVISILP